jgi:hypothetical protein
MARAIEAAPIQPLPAPYVFVEGVFPEAYFAEILSSLDRSRSVFKEQIHKGDPKIFFGSYRDRLEARVPSDTDALPPELSAFWKNLKSELESDIFFGALFEKFAAGFEGRFGARADPATLRPKLRPTLLLTRHRANYYLGPHTDRFEKVVTCIFNFPERSGLEHLGTMMYTPKQEGFTCSGVVHHDPELFDRLHVVPYRPNTGLFFFRDDRLFHGVERLTEESLMGSERPNIQFNLWAN